MTPPPAILGPSMGLVGGVCVSRGAGRGIVAMQVCARVDARNPD